jgi:hypothetical protein
LKIVAKAACDIYTEENRPREARRKTGMEIPTAAFETIFNSSTKSTDKILLAFKNIFS